MKAPLPLPLLEQRIKLLELTADVQRLSLQQHAQLLHTSITQVTQHPLWYFLRWVKSMIRPQPSTEAVGLAPGVKGPYAARWASGIGRRALRLGLIWLIRKLLRSKHSATAP